MLFTRVKEGKMVLTAEFLEGRTHPGVAVREDRA
jgi:hypothetical protein